MVRRRVLFPAFRFACITDQHLGVGNRNVPVTGLFTASGPKPDAGIAFSCLQLGDSLPIALIGVVVQSRKVFRRRASH